MEDFPLSQLHLAVLFAVVGVYYLPFGFGSEASLHGYPVRQQWVAVLDMPILDTRQYRDLIGTFIADLVLSVLSFVAHKERDNIRKRQAEGIKSAKARGVKFGRPQKELPPNFAELAEKWEHGGITTAEILTLCGNMSRSTFYVKLREYRLLSGKTVT